MENNNVMPNEGTVSVEVKESKLKTAMKKVGAFAKKQTKLVAGIAIGAVATGVGIALANRSRGFDEEIICDIEPEEDDEEESKVSEEV